MGYRNLVCKAMWWIPTPGPPGLHQLGGTPHGSDTASYCWENILENILPGKSYASAMQSSRSVHGM